MLFDEKKYSNIDQIDPLFNNLLANKEYTNDIEEKYAFNKKYLDPNFENFFPSNDSFLPKLWELDICDVLTKSQYRDFLMPGRGEGPDFVLSKIINAKDLYIECVCPNRPEAGKESLIENFDFHVKHSNNGIITTQGVDNRIIARYESSIHDKAKKFNSQYEYTADHYRVLCISGSRLARWKSQLHNSKSIIYTEIEFEYCICGQPTIYFSKNPEEESPVAFNYKTYKILKDGTKLYYGQSKDLQTFDAIVFRETTPLIGRTSDTIYKVYYRDDTSKVFRNLLDEIFQSYADSPKNDL